MRQRRSRPALVALLALLGWSSPSETAGWENSLGMRFQSIPGTAVKMCIWETRVRDFEAFCEATGYKAGAAIYVVDPEKDATLEVTNRHWRNPGFAQSPLHPVAGVNWQDARAFCDWLTGFERTNGWITPRQSYRLPSDGEWSMAAGLTNETGSTPQEKFLGVKHIYTWGTNWPPTVGMGNFLQTLNADSFARTSPVGSFAPNASGFFDLAGNVSEWCEDWWNAQRKFRVLRGSAWHLDCELCLMTSYRFPNFPEMRMNTYGFRVVLE